MRFRNIFIFWYRKIKNIEQSIDYLSVDDENLNFVGGFECEGDVEEERSNRVYIYI